MGLSLTKVQVSLKRIQTTSKRPLEIHISGCALAVSHKKREEKVNLKGQ